MKNLEEQGRKS